MKLKLTPIGEIPEEWEVVRLGDESIAQIRGNKTIDGFEKVAFIPMELVPDSSVFVKYEMRPMKEVKSFTYCERGDLLLAKITPSLENGKQGIVPDGIPNGFALATTEVFPISCKGIERLFLFYVLKFPKFRNKIIASMIGTTGRQRASKGIVENLKIPLPPLPEQRKIAEVLSSVDDGIQKVDETISKTQRLKQGLMQELLTKGIGHERFKFSRELGCEIPEEWDVVRLGGESIAELIMGQSPPSSTYNSKGVGLPFLQGNMEFGDIYPTPTLSCTEPIKIAEKNDLLLSVRAPVGEVNINPVKSCIGRGLAAIRSKSDKLDYLFLFYYLKFGSNKLQSISMGSTFKAIRKGEIENFQIPLPPLPEQQKIAEILATVDRKLGLERERKEKLERIKRGLMNELLTGRKRVEIKVSGNAS